MRHLTATGLLTSLFPLTFPQLHIHLYVIRAYIVFYKPKHFAVVVSDAKEFDICKNSGKTCDVAELHAWVVKPLERRGDFEEVFRVLSSCRAVQQLSNRLIPFPCQRYMSVFFHFFEPFAGLYSSLLAAAFANALEYIFFLHGFGSGLVQFLGVLPSIFATLKGCKSITEK